MHPEDRERVLAENKRANREGAPLVLEYRMIAEDGRVVWLRDESVVLRDSEGRPWRRQGIMLDVTERVRTEEALRESQRRLSRLLANAPAYLYSLPQRARLAQRVRKRLRYRAHWLLAR